MDKIILSEWERKKYGDYVDQLRKYPDCFEYCVLPNYEDYMETEQTECIQLGDCFAVLMRHAGHYILVALLFDVEWETRQVLEWLDRWEVRCMRPTTETLLISHANDVVEQIKFKEHPLLLIEKGSKTLLVNPEELVDVADVYDQYKKINNTGLAEDIIIEKN